MDVLEIFLLGSEAVRQAHGRFARRPNWLTVQSFLLVCYLRLHTVLHQLVFDEGIEIELLVVH